MHGNALTGELIARWDALIRENSCFDSPYFQPEFTQLVSEVRDDVEIAFFEDDGDEVAIFPFQRGPFGFGLPVGGLVSDFHGLICTQGININPRELLRECRLLAWQFDHLLSMSEIFAPYQNQIRHSYYIDLRQGFDAYINELQKKSRTRVANIERKKRKIERDIGPLRFEIHTNQSSAVEHLLRWKSRQYADTGVVDVLRHEWVTSLLQKIISRRGKNFSGMLSTLHAGDKLVAVHAGMRSQDVAHYWFPSFDRAFASYSPGIILLLNLARALDESGVRRLDLGAGIEHYKALFGSGSLLVAAGTVDRYGTAETIRKKLYCCRDSIQSTGLRKILRRPAKALHNIRQRVLFK